MIAKKIGLLSLGLGVALASCKKEPAPEPTPDPGNTYTVPSTYNFSNVSYSGQTYRLKMLDEMGTYMATGRTTGVVLSATKLKNMFANSNSEFTDSSLNTCGKQLKNKCYSSDASYFESLMDSVAYCSQSSTAGSNGVAGVVTSSSDVTKKYLFSAGGFEYEQFIKKGLMGAVFYYQAMESYLCANGVGSTVDNTTVISGEGTAMEHHWDEGFGYFGVPVDFPTNVTGIKYWGEYANKMNTALSCNKTLMDAFLKGRAAISNKDYTTRDAQMTIIRNEWEKVCASAVIYELNRAKEVITDDAKRNHYLSEAYGFLLGIKYKSDKKISDSLISACFLSFGSNFYTISTSSIDNIRNTISTAYGLDAVKDIL